MLRLLNAALTLQNKLENSVRTVTIIKSSGQNSAYLSTNDVDLSLLRNSDCLPGSEVVTWEDKTI